MVMLSLSEVRRDWSSLYTEGEFLLTVSMALHAVTPG